MNNKGFTLIELIATIALLAIISVISFVSINNILEQSKISECESTVLNIETALKEYVSDNRYDSTFVNSVSIESGEKVVTITADKLIDEDYLENELYDSFRNVVVDGGRIEIKIYLKDDYTYKSMIIRNSHGEGINCNEKKSFY